MSVSALSRVLVGSSARASGNLLGDGLEDGLEDGQGQGQGWELGLRWCSSWRCRGWYMPWQGC